MKEIVYLDPTIIRKNEILNHFNADLTDDQCEKLQHELMWGTYGPEGNQSIEWKKLSDLSTEHIENIITTQAHAVGRYNKVFLYILKKCYQTEIKVDIPMK